MKRIRELRLKRKASMKQVSLELGIAYTSYVNYEKGYREPNSEMLVRFADYFGVSVDYLIGRSDNINDLKDHTSAMRIKEGLALRGMKQADLVQATGIGKSSISTYISGDYEPKQRNIYKIAKALNVSEAWLMGYDVPPERFDTTIPFPAPNITEDVVTFPVIGTVAAGYDEIAVEDWSGDTVEIPAAYLHGRPRTDYFVLSVHGDSMYPMYLDGDKVLVRKTDTLDHSGQAGIIMYNGDEANLKKIEYVDGEGWLRMVPINPLYPPRTVEGADLERCRILGIPKLLIREIE